MFTLYIEYDYLLSILNMITFILNVFLHSNSQLLN